MFDGVVGFNLGDVLGTVRDIAVSREASKTAQAESQARLGVAERTAVALSQQSVLQDALSQRYVILGLVTVGAIAVLFLLTRE